MKHAGRARQAALKIILLTLVGLMAMFGVCLMAVYLASAIKPVTIGLLVLWVIFVAFTLYFFRDPEARVPSDPNSVLSPGHGTVDAVEEFIESQFMGGSCQRISIFLSVFNVHVQNAPVTGKIAYYKYTTGQFMLATRSESAEHNENLLMGVQGERGVKIGLRLIAGLIARRIVPFVSEGDEIVRGERISLIQFGSRADVYLPKSAKVRIKIGDKVVGGETILATLE